MTETQQLESIFRAALLRVDPYRMLMDHVTLVDERLVVSFDGYRHEEDLSRFNRILILGAGKASARMALAMEHILGDRLSKGLVVVKYGHGEALGYTDVAEAAHPTPDSNGVKAARRLAGLAAGADKHCLVIALISGGGSALLPSPMICDEVTLTLEDKQATTAALLACGADIHQINCLRKHLSGLKGGRLLSLLAPARSLNFILSDVVGDRLDSIASGLTAPDPTSFADCLALVESYNLRDKLPPSVILALTSGAAGRISETLKPGDPALALTTNILIGTNHTALRAACDKATALGYGVVPLTCSLTGEAREAAKILFGIARDVRDHEMLAKRPACIIAGGETVVSLTGNGKGGRNQELALAFLMEMAKDPNRGDGITFLSASTDGSDGPTDAAGAFASPHLLAEAHRLGLSLNAYLRDNDSYHAFQQLGGLLKTGPTMTNVCDLQIALVT